MKTHSDMGCLKIFSDSLSCFFNNGFGDGENSVEIVEVASGEFLGQFTVRESGKVHISKYDCSDDIIYTFKKPGRYFVYLLEMCKFEIEYIDNELHS